MASAALGDELSCSICLNLYTEPVSLRCGHNFCRDCIRIALDTLEKSGKPYSCPECRKKYLDRPLVEKNRKLSNIVENFKSLQLDKTENLCTYCVDSPVAAVKICVQCEVSMCDKHLMAHNKRVDHKLLDSTSPFVNKKCSVHKKLLEYYCCEDATCLCVSCCLVGSHKGHQVELLEEASEKKKDKLRHILKELMPKKETVDERIQTLQDHKRQALEKVDDAKKSVTEVFEGIRRQLKVQEDAVMHEISRQVDQISQSVSGQLQQLEAQKEDLTSKIYHIEKLCKLTDPISLLQSPEPDPAHKDVEEISVLGADGFLILLVLHRSINRFIAGITSQVRQEVTDLSLDAKTAHNNLALSNDLKTASFSERSQNRPETPERFTIYRQVMSVEKFTRGRNYWVVEAGPEGWEIGVSYPSIERGGSSSSFGYNKKSWTVRIFKNKCSGCHDTQKQELKPKSDCRKLGIYLDYEAGRLSFYQLDDDPITQLHTFTTTFTEPLHVAFWVNTSSWVKILP
ncbi:E3 ubiquitin-protein ligase TRIM39-like [Hyperolius riggenbachi]|uniref:E3 ubiquitin-protein ligase TRIM39-like n=1 Tax=Hyperolius riggenbachi TaxID=752182 RepID=UPI0035A3C5D5